jgi:FlgN protein.
VDSKTYIHILTDTLVKKCTVLDDLIQITKLQDEYIGETPLVMDKFDQTLAEKESFIDKLNQLDAGFEKIYEHVREELSENPIAHKEQIKNLQELINLVTQKSTSLQSLELKNKHKLEIYFSNRKKDIKNFKVSNRTASNYYKNMTNTYQADSYFLDKKK